MTPALVRSRVDALRQCAGDAEAAHAMEDKLRADVLAAIAAGSPYAQEMAAAALETTAVIFERWCA